MAYLQLSEARTLGLREAERLQKRAGDILAAGETAPIDAKFDVFLSHSYGDAAAILGVKKLTNSLGLSVYVDWIDDPDLDRNEVTKKTARRLRARMRSSSCLVYMHSPNASKSAWMPWELGYFDGFKPGFIWILPLVEGDEKFKRREYLKL
jgi:hypothetical protein